MILAKAALQWMWRPDGLIHLVTREGLDLPRGPLGVLLYLPFALAYPYVPARSRSIYLILTSYLACLVALGPAYALTILALCLLGFTAVRFMSQPRRLVGGIAICTTAYAALLWCPRPIFLPPLGQSEPLYFYLHWAGIAYLFLKTLHVLIDVGQEKMISPPWRGYLAYMLFAPTLRMGPIYRYPEFAGQLEREPRAHCEVRAAILRFVTGFVRLGALGLLAQHTSTLRLFDDPGSLSAWRFIGSLYAAPLGIYLWISAYVDFAVGMGWFMGFTVPENFNYPWISTSIADFWRRWHMTMGAWLRDYIYIPLGGNRRHVFFNYFITFLLCGLWHGLYLSYALWGISQGVGLGLNRTWRLYWDSKRTDNAPAYQTLARCRLVQSPLNTSARWLLSFHYQILTIALFLDERHAGRLVFAHLAKLIVPALLIGE